MKYNNTDMTPFDMAQPPSGQNIFMLPVIWGAAFAMTRKNRLKITRQLKGIKPPYLVISAHQGFSDYAVAPLALFPHRACYVSDMEGFANFGKSLYRSIGCIGKRRFTPDMNVIRNMKRAVQKNHSIVIFPESRHSNAGTASYIPDNMGGLAKMFAKSHGLPLCVLTIHGSYLANPFWDEERSRKTPITAHLECIFTADELKITSEDIIQREIEKRLSYDEYKWQYDNNIHITESYRAEGLHMPLYQCRKCGTLYKMRSRGSELYCEHCHEKWQLSENGRLTGSGGEIHIPDWYEWERTEAEKAITDDFSQHFAVRIEALPNEKGFVMLGEGKLDFDGKGFTLTYKDGRRYFPVKIMESLQTEFNYQGRGPCIVLSDRNCCYYLYCDNEDFSPMRMQFITEYFYKKGV